MMSRDPDVSWWIGYVYTSGIESYLHQTVFYFLRGQSGPTSTIATKVRNMQTNLHNDFYDCVLSFFPVLTIWSPTRELLLTMNRLVSFQKREFTEPSVNFHLSSNVFISNKNQNGRTGLSFMLSALLCFARSSRLIWNRNRKSWRTFRGGIGPGPMTFPGRLWNVRLLRMISENKGVKDVRSRSGCSSSRDTPCFCWGQRSVSFQDSNLFCSYKAENCS